ncbi:hypothetical protein [Alteribacillus iranensis]|uniref:Uncharacterized protein n=1 Tax=Alteribacillus iranensis TaxID=930128 RepID=A0A1I2BMR7_9BACI|nr:hypothetical protein [Alteribacillus iranensis]SFE57289.1 hypothetical protein SAMN05192532_102397 [Alteribacillus iranensis]
MTTTTLVKTETIHYDQDEVKKVLETLDESQLFEVNQLVFYPYYFFECQLERKSLLQPKGGGKAGCAVDGVNKVGSLVDQSPVFLEKELPASDMIPVTYDWEEAKKAAIDFVRHSITYRMKVLAPPKMTITRAELFYRPYWIAEGQSVPPDRYTLTVDAVSGKYHPL